MNTDSLNKPDPMAEDTIDNVIFDIEDYIGGNIEGRETIDRMGLTVFLRRTIEAYTTNKIIEELERIFTEKPYGYNLNDNSIAAMYIRERIAELKALNHRKDKDE